MTKPLARIPELDSLRGLAALFLVVVHLPRWTAALYDVHAIRRGNVMVEIFFVLSGFIIHRMYADRIESASAAGRFLALRLGRVYPLHLLFLLLYLAVEFARQASGFVGADGPAFGRNSWTAFGQQLLLVHSWGVFGQHDSTFNVAAWSISTELAAYLAFMAVALWVPRAGRAGAWMALAVASAVALAVYIPGFDRLAQCFAGFSVGCLLAVVVQRQPDAACPAWVGWAALAGLCLYLGFKPTDRSTPARAAVYLLVFPLAAALAWAAVAGQTQSLWRRVLRWRPLVWLGDVSYSVYMANLFVILLVDRVARSPRVGLVTSLATEGGTPWPVGLALSALVVGLVLALSAGLYRWVELPARNWVRARVG